MNTNPVSTRMKSADRRIVAIQPGPSSEVDTPPQTVPDGPPRNDFAASAAMVNDILASRPTGDTVVAPAIPAAGPGTAQGSEPSDSHPSGRAAGSDFFASTKSKKTFWQKQFTFRRSRGGDR